MCFTIEVHLSRRAIEERFSVDTSALYDFDFHYFYRAFSNPRIPVIPQHDTEVAHLMQWGLIPSWARDPEQAGKIRKGTYNARSESLHVKPSFRDAFRRGRCLVIAHGYFEWQLVGGKRVPWYIRMKDDQPFVFAGLSDQWKNPLDGELLRTFSIITTEANPLLAKIHNTKLRMPAILPPGLEQEWIREELPPGEAKALLVPLDENMLHAHTVSPLLGKAEADPSNPELIEPFDHHTPGSLF